MRYSDDLVEEIRMKNDIVDVISGYVKLTRRGSSYFGLCPFHNEKSPSFSVSPGKQMYYCFGCGAGGNVFTFLMEYENFTFVEALKFLADRAGVAAREKELAAARQDFERAAMLRDAERDFRQELDRKLSRRSGAEGTVLTAEHVAQVVAQWTGIPVATVTQSES